MWAKRRQFCAVGQLAEQLNAVFAVENGVGRGCSRWQAAGGHANAEDGKESDRAWPKCCGSNRRDGNWQWCMPPGEAERIRQGRRRLRTTKEASLARTQVVGPLLHEFAAFLK